MNSREYKLRKYQAKLVKGGTHEQMLIYQNKIAMYGGTCDYMTLFWIKEIKDLSKISKKICKLLQSDESLNKDNKKQLLINCERITGLIEFVQTIYNDSSRCTYDQNQELRKLASQIGESSFFHLLRKKYYGLDGLCKRLGKKWFFANPRCVEKIEKIELAVNFFTKLKELEDKSHSNENTGDDDDDNYADDY